MNRRVSMGRVRSTQGGSFLGGECQPDSKRRSPDRRHLRLVPIWPAGWCAKSASRWTAAACSAVALSSGRLMRLGPRSHPAQPIQRKTRPCRPWYKALNPTGTRSWCPSKRVRQAGFAAAGTRYNFSPMICWHRGTHGPLPDVPRPAELYLALGV
jgi:hypothetical protein